VIDKSKLSPSSAAAYAAHEFLGRHGDFFPTKRNWQVLDDYMAKHKMGRSLEAYERAYRQCYSEILSRAESIAVMSAAETKEFAQTYGTPVQDPTTGKCIGHEFPPAAEPLAPAVLTQRTSLGQTITARTAAPLKNRSRQPSITRALTDFIPRK